MTCKYQVSKNNSYYSAKVINVKISIKVDGAAVFTNENYTK